MRPLLFIACSVLSLVSSHNVLAASSVVDQLVTRTLEKNLPEVLYDKADIPWDYGVYTLKISKAGQGVFKSNSNTLNGELPIHVALSGKAEKEIFGSLLKMDCEGQFNTTGALVITPLFDKDLVESDILINVPIPEAMLNCQGLQIPIKIPLEQLLADEKPKWEKRIKTEVDNILKQLGI